MSDSNTADDLIYEVASIIWNTVAGEPLPQPQYDAISNTIDRVLAEIEGIAYVGDRDSIENKYFYAIADIVALRARTKASGVRATRAEIEDAERRLRYLAAQPPTYQTQKTVNL